MSTSQKFITAVVIVVVLLQGRALPPVVVLVGLAAYMWFVMRTQSSRAQKRTDAPASDVTLRLYAALSKANIRREAVVWTAGPGRPYIRKQGNQLLISASMVEQLNDEELLAMVQEVWVVHPAAYWIEFVRTPGPWLMLAGIVGLAFFRVAPLLVLVGFVWSVYANASGKIAEAVAHKGGIAFLAQGGEMASLLGALTKNYTALLDVHRKRRAELARTANKLLRLLARLGDIPEGQLVDIVRAAGGAPDIIEPPPAPKFWTQQSPYGALFSWLLIWLVILIATVLVASWFRW